MSVQCSLLFLPYDIVTFAMHVAKRNKLVLLLKSHYAVISLKNALRDKGFKVPNLMKKCECGNPITSNERQAYMGSAQSSPEGQA